jgi:2-phosphoglycerate kinase
LASNFSLRDQLSHVYWIGGGSGGGKSTLARRFAEQYNMHLYATDDVMQDHGSRSTPENAQLIKEFTAMSMDERWVSRSPQTMFDTFHWFQGECFEMIVDDLLRLPKNRGIIVEGFRLLPGLVQPLLSTPNQAIWLLPTPRFREVVFNKRGGTGWAFLAKTSNPEKALHNLLERDKMFTDHLREEMNHLGLTGIEIDTTMTEEQLVDQVAQSISFNNP